MTNEIDLTRFEGHTAGPWHKHQRKDVCEIYGQPGNSRLICWGQVMRGDAQAVADAQLISAAPALLAEVTKLRAEIAALRADAERYRWLRSRPEVVPTFGPDLAMWADCSGDAIRGDEADKAIDAAMKNGA